MTQEKNKKMKNQNDEMETQTKLTPMDVDLSAMGEIELPSLNIEQHIGKKVKIVSVKPFMSAKFSNPVIKVETEVVEVIKRKDGKADIELRGSRLFGLFVDDSGKIGYGLKTKLGVFMQKMKCKSPQELIGKTVILQGQTGASGTEFLSFN